LALAEKARPQPRNAMLAIVAKAKFTPHVE
jgi:hypothetical protein